MSEALMDKSNNKGAPEFGEGGIIPFFAKSLLSASNDDSDEEDSNSGVTIYRRTPMAKDFFEEFVKKIVKGSKQENFQAIAISGKSRIGKSTLIRHLFNLTDFRVGAGFEPVTQGIDMLNKFTTIN